MTQDVEQYFLEGCGRCPFFATPDCKVHNWSDELGVLREILKDSGLKEECTWGAPCYTHKGKNVLTLSALKAHVAIGFFKGHLIKDKIGLLVKPGKNTQSGRQMRFTDLEKSREHEKYIREIIQEAIQIESSDIKADSPKDNMPDFPVELQEFFESDPEFKDAFESLTPGRQRGFLIYFNSAKQSTTRLNRIIKYSLQLLPVKECTMIIALNQNEPFRDIINIMLTSFLNKLFPFSPQNIFNFH